MNYNFSRKIKPRVYERKNFYRFKQFRKDMTYILGARCKDGVVLVGDTKVTVDGGADYAYEKKITFPVYNVVMGSAGIGGLYKEFQNRVLTAIVQMEKERLSNEEEGFPFITTDAEFSVLLSNVIREMHFQYGNDSHIIDSNLMILCASRISPSVQLTTVTGYGFPEPVNGIRAIGHGEPYASLFQKKLWKKDMTMEQTAKLGLFIIKFIEEMKLDSTVGYDKEFLPQIVYVPDVKLPKDFLTSPISTFDEWVERQKEYQPYLEKHPIIEVSKEDTNHLLNEVGGKIAEFNSFFLSGEFKI